MVCVVMLPSSFECSGLCHSIPTIKVRNLALSMIDASYMIGSTSLKKSPENCALQENLRVAKARTCRMEHFVHVRNTLLLNVRLGSHLCSKQDSCYRIAVHCGNTVEVQESQ
jgi:hypothetical protein